MRRAVTGQAKLVHRAVLQQTRIRRAVRRVTSRTAFGLHRSVFESEWSLLINVTLDAAGVGPRGQSGLLQLKAAVRVVTIAATHRAFQNFVVERHVELRLNFTVTTHAELRVVRLQHPNRREAGLLSVWRSHQQI